MPSAWKGNVTRAVGERGGPESAHQLRCIGCGSLARPGAPPSDFRCGTCGNLFEVEYPSWSAQKTSLPGTVGGCRPNASALRWLWQERRSSPEWIDQSGVWRFRDLLPILDQPEKAVTLREGNTPLYKLPRCSEALGVPALFAKHQGMNPTGSFKDTGMTAALSVACERGYRCYGGVCCASWDALAGADPGRKDLLG